MAAIRMSCDVESIDKCRWLWAAHCMYRGISIDDAVPATIAYVQYVHRRMSFSTWRRNAAKAAQGSIHTPAPIARADTSASSVLRTRPLVSKSYILNHPAVHHHATSRQTKNLESCGGTPMFVLASSEKKNGAQLLITTARTGARPRSGDRATRTPRRGARARTARGTASRGCVQREAGRENNDIIRESDRQG
ncbi:hypothetical protein BJ912DRAFT_1128355 [Pholiota molesta]|nr:hypothetical protein BJ912DRAFT_1104987 [Pholiota molesta]KAF8179422.1 hypothetical protein BJ912DRAFT_1128355 [Pholiota molesta]